MFDNLKRKCPSLYDLYQTMQRKATICSTRHLSSLCFKDKKRVINKQYKAKIGHELDWSNLRTYTEKMQWEKLCDKNPIKTELSDKYKVRKWVTEKIGEQYLIPLVGAWDTASEVPFSDLPKQFVLKTNHGSGTNIIVKDKSKCNWKSIENTLSDWMRTDFAYTTCFEMQYSGIPRKIICEQYMETDRGELQDYKFLCFNEKPVFCWVDLGRFGHHTRTVFDMDWNLQPWTQAEYGISDEKIPEPKNFDEMKKVAETLCQGFSHVRVDLYNIDGTVYFGEMTFTNGSGLDRIVPEQYDAMLGEMWPLPIT